MNDNFQFLCDEMKKLAVQTMMIVDRIHDAICVDSPNEVSVIGYLNYASSLISTAKAIYVSNAEILERNDIDDFFAQFDVFVMEVLDNIAENHSHQWSYIEYDKLKEDFSYCILSQ